MRRYEVRFYVGRLAPGAPRAWTLRPVSWLSVYSGPREIALRHWKWGPVKWGFDLVEAVGSGAA